MLATRNALPVVGDVENAILIFQRNVEIEFSAHLLSRAGPGL